MLKILNSNSQTYGNLASEKLRKQAKEWNGSHGVVRDGVLNALIHFCQQSEEFAQKIHESDKTFDDCLKVVLDKHGVWLSDIEAYRRAVSFYFEAAEISFEMVIQLPSSKQKEKSAVILNLFDIF